MTRRRLTKVFSVLSALIGGCTASGPRAPTTTPPVSAEAADTGGTEDLNKLRLSVGSFQYRLRQNTKVHAKSSTDTTPSSITTTARLSVDVTLHSDSGYAIIVSVDSLKISSEGLIPSRSVTDVSSLGPVLGASFRGNNMTVETYLPDSLCAYSQFITAARKLLLPPLPIQIRTPLTEVWVDTATTISCRAGTRIEILTIQQIKDLRREPHEFTLDERTELRGAGILNRDSVIVAGSIRTLGSALFTNRSRLPSLVQTESDGSITVRLGNSTMVFRQTSTQFIEQEARLPN